MIDKLQACPYFTKKNNNLRTIMATELKLSNGRYY